MINLHGDEPSDSRPAVRASGPLLTGSAAADIAFGFLSEFAALALLLYGGFLVILSLENGTANAQTMLGVGAAITGLATLLSTNVLQTRYASFARGWRAGRAAWGKAGNQFLTFLIGVAVLVVVFPLGIWMGIVVTTQGPLAILAAVSLAYLIGALVRGIARAKKEKQSRSGG